MSSYDQIGRFYAQFVTNALNAPFSHYRLTLETMLEMVGDVSGQAVCDLACGEGELSRLLAARGAQVVGVDISAVLLEQAAQKTASPSVRYVHDDATRLSRLAENEFDVVVCNMALMDIGDMMGLFSSAWRVLEANGRFLISFLHPCFETPFTMPHEQTETDGAGNVIGCRVGRYGEEGFWQSGGTGIRGQVGAHHRQLSTILNALIKANFALAHISEPMLPTTPVADTSAAQWSQQVARSILIECQKLNPM